MGRSLTVLRSVAGSASAFLLLMLLTGCLSTEVSVSLRENGSGTVNLGYRIDRAAWDVGVFDDSDVARAIPVTRREFEDAVLQIEGLRLRSHRIDRGQDLVTVDVRLDFDTPEALRRLLGAEALEINPGASGSWRQVVAEDAGVAGPGALAPELEPYTIRLILTPPRPVSATNGEMLRDGRAAAYTITLADIARATEAVVWEVRW